MDMDQAQRKDIDDLQSSTVSLDINRGYNIQSPITLSLAEYTESVGNNWLIGDGEWCKESLTNSDSLLFRFNVLTELVDDELLPFNRTDFLRFKVIDKLELIGTGSFVSQNVNKPVPSFVDFGNYHHPCTSVDYDYGVFDTLNIHIVFDLDEFDELELNPLRNGELFDIVLGLNGVSSNASVCFSEFKLVVTFSDSPKIDSEEDVVWNRIRCKVQGYLASLFTDSPHKVEMVDGILKVETFDESDFDVGDDEFECPRRSGGGGGTTDYNELSNKPKINSVTLSGNKSLEDLGIYIPSTDDFVKLVDLDSLVSSYGYLKTHQSLEDYYTKTEVDSALEGKVDVEVGKGLSSNDYTTTEKSKLASLENYDDTDVKSDIQDLQITKADKTELDDYTKTVDLKSVTDTFGYLTSHQSLSNYYTKGETDSAINGHHDSSKQDKLTAGTNITIVDNVISAIGGGIAQVQSDYAQTDSTQIDYIKNKPNIESICREIVIEVLNEKFNGKIADVEMVNGKLKKYNFNSGDFDD